MQYQLPRVIGHRGAMRKAPENTIAGIDQAAREGATWVEFDVKLTRDGIPVLLADEARELDPEEEVPEGPKTA